MDKILYNPKVYGTIENGNSVISPKISGIVVNESTRIKPFVNGVISRNFDIHSKPEIMGIYEPDMQIKSKLIVQAVITQPKEKEFDVNGPNISMSVYKKNWVDNHLPIKMEVERVGSKKDNDTTIIGYNTNVYPFATYQFNNREYFKVQPYITYITNGGINIDANMYVTYIDYAFGAKKLERRYYAVFHSNYMNKDIKCRLYDKTVGFPLRGAHISVLCDDNHIRYLPIDLLGSDFDSGIRCSDKWGNQYQICLMRQENMISKFFPFGNMIMPLTSYNDLYAILTGIFGKARVELGENCLYFSPPSAASGITKFMCVGLNIRITTCHGQELTTYNNGLNSTSYGGDYHWTANKMLLKMRNREKFKIEFDNSYHGTTYKSDALVKNFLIFGQTVEALKEESASMELLINNHRWYLFNVKKNEIKSVNEQNDDIKYVRENYLEYSHSPCTYNYYDLGKYKCFEPDK